MSAHTKGPWHADEPDCNCDINVCPSHEALAVAVTVQNGWRGERETKANARLIAAAPELLDALKQAVATHDYDGRCGWIEAAKAAIAKAEGENNG